MRRFFRSGIFSAILCLCMLSVPAFCGDYPYYLSVFRQMVAIYETETNQWYVTGTPVYSLPLSDQEALFAGIPLASAQAGTAALEDFCS